MDGACRWLGDGLMPLGANKIALFAASAGGFSASGGTETTYDSGGTTYMVHTFTTSGTFTIEGGSGDVDILMIAGAGGAAGGTGNINKGGGGGGAGGQLEGSAIEMTAGDYTITIGGGGGQYTNGRASTIVETTWGTATAVGGGGGPHGPADGNSGGSGGGAAGRSAASGGAATQGDSNGLTGYGYAGGNSFYNASGEGAGGGGGGAGGVGGNAPARSSGGAKGVGRSNLIQTGSGDTRAIGGYGAAAQNWGPGNGASGAANSGNGGDGDSGTSTTGGSGGSGTVVFRYAA